MTKLLCTLLFCSAAFATPGTVIASSAVTNTTSGGVQTLSVTLNCTGANAYFVGAAYAKGTGMSVSDSQGGMWSSNTNKPGFDNADAQGALWYSLNRGGGSVTISVTSQYQSFIAFCASNVAGPVTVDLSTQPTTTNCGQCQVGPFSSSTDEFSVLVGMTYSTAGAPATTDSGYSMLGTNALVSAQHYGVAVAYRFFTGSGSVAPSFYGLQNGGDLVVSLSPGAGDGSNGSGGGSTGIKRRVIL